MNPRACRMLLLALLASSLPLQAQDAPAPADPFCPAVREVIQFLAQGPIEQALGTPLGRSGDGLPVYGYAARFPFPGQTAARFLVADGVLAQTVSYQIFLDAAPNAGQDPAPALLARHAQRQAAMETCLAGLPLKTATPAGSLARAWQADPAAIPRLQGLALGLAPAAPGVTAISLEFQARAVVKRPDADAENDDEF